MGVPRIEPPTMVAVNDEPQNNAPGNGATVVP